ncbi:predicted protein [Naegleria gruberi]|uniref:Predicted protein n=1 Tax=Naegleria gruberi TaxID=5762 RepID=D2VQ59_NAEGR|nr:uncharacterized protein NAEGRDRAFT_71032 [Naegleria gruberi]EFC41049.1 predicted protein [Naegleria gruberi]|eukprot:XP_002673793.1 predicted protein [Naegleria gruberi strain NEG-M]
MYNTNNNTPYNSNQCNIQDVTSSPPPFTVSTWQVDETCSTSRIPGKIRSRCDPKCFFHWKNQKMTMDDNLLFPLSHNSSPLFHVECKKISKKPHHHHHQHSNKSISSCKITFDDSLSYPPHKSNVNNQSMFEFVPFKLESLPKDYSLSYMTNVTKKKPNFNTSNSNNHQTSLSDLRNRLNEENLKKPNETLPTLQPISIQSESSPKELSPKGTRTRIFSIKELLN